MGGLRRHKSPLQLVELKNWLVIFSGAEVEGRENLINAQFPIPIRCARIASDDNWEVGIGQIGRN